MIHDEVVPILDFGSQYAQLIARRVREKGVYSVLTRPDISVDELRKLNPKGIILSGGPNSVYEPNAPRCDPKIFDLDIPILGICYGMQLGVQILGGQVQPARAREYGSAKLKVTTKDPFVKNLPAQTTVWMSHGDQIFELPADFVPLGRRPRVRTPRPSIARVPFTACSFIPRSRTRRAASSSSRIFFTTSAAARARGRWVTSPPTRSSACGSR
jgi:GMP synthase (glutamine-hydrolysing)